MVIQSHIEVAQMNPTLVGFTCAIVGNNVVISEHGPLLLN